MLRNLNISIKILVGYIILFLIFVAIIGFFSVEIASQGIDQEILDSDLAETRALAGGMEAQVIELRSATELLAHKFDEALSGLSTVGSPDQLVEEQFAENGALAAVFVIDGDTVTYEYTRQDPPVPLTGKSIEEFPNLQESIQLLREGSYDENLSNIFLDFDPESGSIILPERPVAYLLHAIEGDATRILGVKFNADYLIEPVVNSPENEHLRVTNKDGYYIYHPDSTHEFGSSVEKNTGFQLQNDLPELAVEALKANEYQDVNDGEYHVGIPFFPLIDYSSDFFVLVKVSPSASILSDAGAGLRNIMVVLGLGSVGLLIAMGLFVHLSVTRPIRKLQDQAFAIASGKEEGKVAINSRDEIGELAKSFNQMATALQENNRLLEKKVAEKTVELERQLKKTREQNENLENIKTAMFNLLEDLEEGKNSIEEAKANTDAILESIGEGLVALDNKGKVTFVNEQAERMLGATERDLVGKAWNQCIDLRTEQNEHVKSEEWPFGITQKTSAKVFEDKYYYSVDEKEIFFPVAITSAPIVKDEQKEGVIVVFRDITREKEIDKVKSEFVSMASHQLRTPLSAINWYTEMLMEDKTLSEEHRDYAKEIYQGNQRMVGLVNALLDVSRVDLGTFQVNPKPTDIREVSDSVLHELEPKIIEREVEVVRNYDKDMPEISVDPDLTRIIFQNLLSNGVKYNKQGGKLEVAVGMDNEHARISVKDEGVGIPDEMQEKIFTKLYRADNVKEIEGTGLGLYTIKQILEAAGGSIGFESKHNQGSMFWVNIPKQGMRAKSGSKKLSGDSN